MEVNFAENNVFCLQIRRNKGKLKAFRGLQ
jgi:hypothetical protein